MQVFTPPASWDAKEFAARYSLNMDTDFYVDAEGGLVVFPDLKDNPPVFDLPDPPGPPLKDRLDAVTTLTQLIPILKEHL